MPTTIGVYPRERKLTQVLIADIELFTDLTTAAASDSITDTPDYAALSSAFIKHASVSRYELLESLAESLCGIALKDTRITGIQLTLTKPGAVSAAENVGVRITRHRD